MPVNGLGHSHGDGDSNGSGNGGNNSSSGGNKDNSRNSVGGGLRQQSIERGNGVGAHIVILAVTVAVFVANTVFVVPILVDCCIPPHYCCCRHCLRCLTTIAATATVAIEIAGTAAAVITAAVNTTSVVACSRLFCPS
jgi:hypothetical protein